VVSGNSWQKSGDTSVWRCQSTGAANKVHRSFTSFRMTNRSYVTNFRDSTLEIYQLAIAQEAGCFADAGNRRLTLRFGRILREIVHWTRRCGEIEIMSTMTSTPEAPKPVTSKPVTSRSVAWRRKFKAAERNAHGLWQILKALASTDHPLLAHLIPIRRCNLSCTYCNEYDDFSKPVSTDQMLRRVDLLGDLGTSVITISGGEPLLHPQLDDIIHHMRRRRIVSGMITNGYLLTADRIQKLNRAGLEWLQISIDNVNPDEVSKKSLKVLDKKLQLLSEHADFHVNINSVVGGGVSHPQDALTIGKRALELGFSSTVGIIHDGSGQVQPLTGEEQRVYHEMKNLEKRSFTRINSFQDNIALGKPNEWRCRAGARYLYICEDGLVHYCSQQRGYPGIPLEKYTVADIRREFQTEKSCAPHCTVSCVHQVSVVDGWRAPQLPAPPTASGLVQIE
jgi:MoaA/NifB/PqqE/SkfB family radical SAM enzyme